MPPLPTTAHRMQPGSSSLETANSLVLSEPFRRLRVEAMAVGVGQGGAPRGVTWVIGAFPRLPGSPPARGLTPAPLQRHRGWRTVKCQWEEGGGAGGLAVPSVISRTHTSPPRTVCIPKENNRRHGGAGGRFNAEGALGGFPQKQPPAGCLRPHSRCPRPPLGTGIFHTREAPGW